MERPLRAQPQKPDPEIGVRIEDTEVRFEKLCRHFVIGRVVLRGQARVDDRHLHLERWAPAARDDRRDRLVDCRVQRNADRKQRIAEAGGQLVAAAVRLLGELLPRRDDTPQVTEFGAIMRDQLAGAVDTDAAGRPVLALTLPDRAALDGIAQLLGGLLARMPTTAGVLN